MAITHPDRYSHWRPEDTRLIDGQLVRFRDVCVHEIRMGDVEDPDVMVAEPIWRWQQTEAGQWVMQNAIKEPYWIQSADPVLWGHLYRIMARLSEQNETFWRLKWGGLNK